MFGQQVNSTRENGKMATRKEMVFGKASQMIHILESGETTSQMDSASMYMALEICTKVNGNSAFVTAKDQINSKMETFMWANTTMAKLKASDNTPGATVIHTQVNSSTARSMVKAAGRKAKRTKPTNTLENTRKTRSTVTASSSGKQAPGTKETTTQT